MKEIEESIQQSFRRTSSEVMVVLQAGRAYNKSILISPGYRLSIIMTLTLPVDCGANLNRLADQANLTLLAEVPYYL